VVVKQIFLTTRHTESTENERVYDSHIDARQSGSSIKLNKVNYRRYLCLNSR